LFIGLGILAVGIVLLIIGLQRSPAFWQAFQCGYNLRLNNSSPTRDQISEYCNNNQTLKTENAEDLITIGFGIIVIVIGFIITGTGCIWLIIIRRRKERTEESPSSGLSIEMMNNNNGDSWFAPKKVLAFCIIVGLISGSLSIFITSLILLSVAAFVFCLYYIMVYVC
jgi:hypothetical protein